MIVGYEGETQSLEEDAKGILSLLWNCYPGHPWYVHCRPGHVFIQYLSFRSKGTWGMSLRVTEVDHDAAVFKKKIISLAGEWLERAGIARGRYEEGSDASFKVEGVPDSFTPQALPEEQVKFVQPDSIDKLRQDAHPLAIKNVAS